MKLSALPLALTALPLLLSACGSDNDNNDLAAAGISGPEMAVVSTTAADYSSGSPAVFATDAPYRSTDSITPGNSSLTVACHGDYFYRIENFGYDNITRYAFDAPTAPLTQFSTNGNGESNSNPYDVVFANDTKAYVLRYGSNTLWVVNPSATTEADFKTGEIDLSAYAQNANEVANMSAAVMVDGYLLVAMQRMDTSDVYNWQPGTAYVAVIDTLTDQEIPDLPAIELPITNPSDIEYNADTGLVYVLGTGTTFNYDYNGGIASIDINKQFATTLILDDGDTTDHPLGAFTQMEIINGEVAYVAGAAGWNDDSVYRFNPATGQVDADANGNPLPVAGLAGLGIGGLAQDASGQLWVSYSDTNTGLAGIRLLEANSGDIIEQRLPTLLNPAKIAICSTGAE